MAFFTRSTLLATLIMIMAQLTLAVIAIGNKFLIRQSFRIRVLVAHRLVVGAVVLLVYAVAQRGCRDGPRLTWTVVGLGVICGFLGGFASSNIYVLSLSLGSATAATAISNMGPAISLIMAIVFRLETVDLRILADRVKVLGTGLAIVGAMIISFYEGGVIRLWPSEFRVYDDPSLIPFIIHLFDLPAHAQLLAVVSAILSCITSSASIMIEAKIMQLYPCPVGCSALIVTMGALQCLSFALLLDGYDVVWYLNSPLVVSLGLFAALIGSGLMMVLTAWVIQEKGPFFLSIFGPLTMVAVSVFSPVFVDEQMHWGSVIGGCIIVVGVYLVLWGKKQEHERQELERQERQTVEEEPLLVA